MKVSCPKCKKVFQAPEEWAGKKVKCPGCKNPIALPAQKHGPSKEDLGFDLESLDELENQGQVIVRERTKRHMTLAEAQAAAAQSAVEQHQADPENSDPTIRVCPRCGQKVKCEDVYCDLICRSCDAEIPSLMSRDKNKGSYKTVAPSKPKINFYNGFTGAAFYPVPALGSIGTGMAIALAAICVPIIVLVGVVAISNLNEAAERTEITWLGMFLKAMFALEGVYFGAITYYILIDTIRTTTSGNEQPPGLTFNLAKIGPALGGYVALIAFYVVVILGILTLTGEGMPTQLSDFGQLAKPVNLLILALLTLPIPMNMIGLASGSMANGLNPAGVVVSIGKLIGHYIFLYLIVILYLGLYAGLMIGAMQWAMPQMMEAARQGIQAGLLKLVLSVVAWSALIGLGFYFAYMVGRILGLFARTYQKRLAFEL